MAGKLEDRVREIIVDQLGVNAEQVNKWQVNLKTA